ncbi:hypothetical protein VTI74DRAFT_3793 [Chaetomium olivicolor]
MQFSLALLPKPFIKGGKQPTPQASGVASMARGYITMSNNHVHGLSYQNHDALSQIESRAAPPSSQSTKHHVPLLRKPTSHCRPTL